jgi:hypothetical protein
MKSAVLASLLQLSLLPAFATGQRINGTVSARESEQPIAAALVQLIARDSTVLNSVLTDPQGRFLFTTDGCGPQDGYLFVMRIGYRALRVSLVDLPADCSAWSITLEADPVRLPALTARAARNRDLERVGFYQRKQIGLGTFIDRATLEERYDIQSRTADVLQRIPTYSASTRHSAAPRCTSGLSPVRRGPARQPFTSTGCFTGPAIVVAA